MTRIIACGKSHMGRRRSNNEDSFFLNPEKGLAVVADGMGGLEFGEVASRVFCETAEEMFAAAGSGSDEEVAVSVKEAFRLANERVCRIVEETENSRGMGCTAEMIFFNPDCCVIGHVGDSRTYLFRAGKLSQVTRDHSLVQEQLDEGLIAPEQTHNHPMGHIITRAVGIEKTLQVDILHREIKAGDVFLLCSDGLTDMVDDGVIRDILARQEDLGIKVDALIEQANAAGGKDNITVVLCAPA